VLLALGDTVTDRDMSDPAIGPVADVRDEAR
jgi:hypothetical protein